VRWSEVSILHLHIYTPYTVHVPLPTALPTPGPPGVSFSEGSGGGGPSIERDTTASPLRMIRLEGVRGGGGVVGMCATCHSHIEYWRHKVHTQSTRHTYPNTRFSSFSSLKPVPFLFFIFLCSSQSPSTKFMCLSKAINVPTKHLLSCNVILIRYPTYVSILLVLCMLMARVG